jgi:hypothetical protein
MGTDLDRYSYEPRDMSEGLELARHISASRLAPRGLKPEDIFLVMAAGREYGWSTMRSLRSLYVIDGRVCMYADAILGLVKAAPCCLYFRLIESTATSATMETHRNGSPEPERMSYDEGDAKKAKLWGRQGPWTNYPADMLRARCAVRLARAVYPDIVGGIYAPDELVEVRYAVSEPVAPASSTSLIHDDEGVVTHIYKEPVARYEDYLETVSAHLAGMDFEEAAREAVCQLTPEGADEVTVLETKKYLWSLMRAEMAADGAEDATKRHVVQALARHGYEQKGEDRDDIGRVAD